MSENNYSFSSRLLHKLALGNDVLPEVSFDVEKMIYEKEIPRDISHDHVFVAGLARAGTTIIMRVLYGTGEFCSLTYRDMPFVLAPNLWGKMSGLSSYKGASQTRSHGDGIDIDVDSPEALEEVFWRVFSGEKYLKDDSLRLMEASEETLRNYQTYISLILYHYESKRYLSKNNNNIIRLAEIHRAFPRAKIIVPFRHPVQHAVSLLNQHKLFKEKHKEDAFTHKYMNWLVHHEFGLDHRPFGFREKFTSNSHSEELEYWLELWLYTYGHLLEQYREGEIDPLFMSFDLLCERPQQMLSELGEKLDIPVEEESAEGIEPPPKKEGRVENSELRARLEEVHNSLKELSHWHL